MITSGATTIHTTPASDDRRILELVQRAVDAKLSFIQIREKQLSARTLYELTAHAARLTRRSATRLLVNDRADVALAGGADGVHLTMRSLGASLIRRRFARELLIGASTHSLQEARTARESGADFATFGPVYGTRRKRFTARCRPAALGEAALRLAPFPLLALGGVGRASLPELSHGRLRRVAISPRSSPDLAGLIDEINEMFSSPRGV
ncbi:MAG: thiamine phosphate synthase [Pyrinomonadaceae bacterium]